MRPDPHRRPAPSPARRLPGLRGAALDAEAMGYDIAYTWDHFYPLYGDPDGAHLECWSILAAWAEATDRDRDRAARQLHLLSQRPPAGRHRSHPRPDQRRPDDPRASGPAGSAATTRVRLRVRDAGARGSSRLARRSRDARAGWTARPAAGPAMPLLIGGIGEQRTLRLVAATRTAGTRCSRLPGGAGAAVAALLVVREIGRDPAEIEWGVGRRAGRPRAFPR